MLLTAVITEAEEGGFIALNPETGTTTQGETYQEAIQNKYRFYSYGDAMLVL